MVLAIRRCLMTRRNLPRCFCRSPNSKTASAAGAVMMPLDFVALAQQCAPQVSPVTMAAIVRTESGFNPYAIGVANGRLVRQPASLDEAVSTARALAAGGWNFSAGLAQVNHAN